MKDISSVLAFPSILSNNSHSRHWMFGLVSVGLIAGVWYRRDGLITATGIHFWADIIWHVIWPVLLGVPYLVK